jgi:hypothetical protein
MSIALAWLPGEHPEALPPPMEAEVDGAGMTPLRVEPEAEVQPEAEAEGEGENEGEAEPEPLAPPPAGARDIGPPSPEP